MNMKKLSMIFVSAVMVILAASCGPKVSQSYYDFESKLIAVEGDGTYTIRAFGRGRNTTHAYAQAQKQALKDVIFKGVQPASAGMKPLKPLIFEINAEDKYQDYFDNFFVDGGEYLKYVSYKERKTSSTNFSRNDVQSTAEVTVSVLRTELKQRLIKDGIIKQ